MRDAVEAAGTARRDILAVSLAWALSRLAATAAGVRFDIEPLIGFWQTISRELLESRLLESVWYDHAQPPLFGLFLGLGLKAFGPYAFLFFAITHWLLTLSLGATMLLALRALRVRRSFALMATLMLVLSPPAILYEHFLLYTHWVVVTLCAAAWALTRALTTNATRHWIVFFGLIATLVLTRSVFHLIFWAAVTAGVVLARRHQPKPAMLAAALGLALILGPFLKNQIVFGFFGTSSWLGMSMARMTLRQMPESTLEAWVREGRLEPIALVKPYQSAEVFFPILGRPPETGRRILDDVRKPDGQINLRHSVFLRASPAYMRQAKVVLREAPGHYVRSVLLALRYYVSPATSWHPLAPNLAAIAPYARTYDTVLHFPVPIAPALGRAGLMPFLLVLALLGGLYEIVRALRAGEHAHAAVIAFLTGTILYVTLVANMLEIRENMRFRYTIDPFVHMVLAVLASRALDGAQRHSTAAVRRG